MMSVSIWLDGLHKDSVELGIFILVSTTCVMLIYLLFNLSTIIENLIQKKTNSETTIEIDKDTVKIKQINIGKATVEIDYKQLRLFFWKLIGLAYIAGFAFIYAIVLIIPLFIILIFSGKKLIRKGIGKGLRSVLRLPPVR